MKKPKYVSLNGTLMRLRGNEYWVDGGMWGVRFKEKTVYDPQKNFEESIELVSIIDVPHLNNKVLHPCSEYEWYMANKHYVPNDYVFEDGTKTPPQLCSLTEMNGCSLVSPNNYKYLLIGN